MPKYDLYYFPAKALGEPLRLLLAYGGEDWEDHRLNFDTEWPAFKPKTPYGQVPVLEFDGKKHAQTTAIARYLGRKHGLAGATLEEDLVIDEHVEFYNEIKSKAAAVQYEKHEGAKAQKIAEFNNAWPALLDKLDSIIKENNGHLGIDKLTWADFLFAGVYPYLKKLLQIPDLDERYPAFKKLVETVYSLPKVKAYADKAPETEY